MAIAQIIAAVVGAQTAATDSNMRKTQDGMRVGDARHGNLVNEPWLDALGNRMGWEATPGVAYSHGDKSAKGAALDYWTDPARGQVNYAMQNTLGKTATNVLDPVSAINKYGLNGLRQLFG